MIASTFAPLYAWANPWIGIELAPGKVGVKVAGIVPGSPAAKTSLVPGDEILTIDETSVHAPNELRSNVAQRQAGEHVRLSVASASGATRDVLLVLQEKPDERALLRDRLVGRPAPAFSLEKIGAGEAHETLAQHRGRPFVIDFWATWCGPCVHALPAVARLHEKHPRVDVIGISTEDHGVVAEGTLKLGITHPSLVDEGAHVSRAYGITALPTFIVVDRTGIVRDVVMGVDLDHLDEAMGAVEGK